MNLRSPGQNAAYLRWVKEVAYVHVETGVVVELHHRVTDNPSLLPLDFAALWAEREEVGSVALRLRPCRGIACPSIFAFMAPFMRDSAGLAYGFRRRAARLERMAGPR